MNEKQIKNVQFVYDAECPLCNHFACKMENSYNNVELINAREKSELVDMAQAMNFDIDQGAIMKANGQLLYGSSAMVYLARNIKPFGILGWFFIGLFRFSFVARALYPVLVLVRKLLLRVKGKSLINQEPDQELNQELIQEPNQELIQEPNQELRQATNDINVYYNSACPVCDSGIESIRKKIDSEQYTTEDKSPNRTKKRNQVRSQGRIQGRSQSSCQNIVWNDVHKDQSSMIELDAELEFVRKRLHVVDGKGVLHVGIDAFIALWEVSPNGQWKARFFRFPFIHGFASLSYKGVAWLLYRWNRLLNHW